LYKRGFALSDTFKFGSSTFDFKQMKVFTPNGWNNLYFSTQDEDLYRMAISGYNKLSPKITEAYLEWKIEQMLLGAE
jgi:hypothetical protein